MKLNIGLINSSMNKMVFLSYVSYMDSSITNIQCCDITYIDCMTKHRFCDSLHWSFMVLCELIQDDHTITNADLITEEFSCVFAIWASLLSILILFIKHSSFHIPLSLPRIDIFKYKANHYVQDKIKYEYSPLYLHI